LVYFRLRVIAARSTALVAITVAVGARPLAAEAQSDPHAMFTGQFHFAGGARERAALDAALEREVQGMFFAIRPIARSRLRALNPAYASVTIRFVNGNIEMVLPGAPFFRSPESGASIAWTAEDGNPAHLSQRFDGTRIVQSIVASNGSRRNTYTVSPDGQTLTMSVYITAGQLPGPLAYTLTYRR
jgi:hypothetical protein